MSDERNDGIDARTAAAALLDLDGWGTDIIGVVTDPPTDPAEPGVPLDDLDAAVRRLNQFADGLTDIADRLDRYATAVRLADHAARMAELHPMRPGHYPPHA